mmetsp:Transcript_71597/g.127022  ORF Transcript_71597/g.127022 Transcript_71597/m.127022 type:complete len:242 (+) Transcript_71597:2546-3271(+)
MFELETALGDIQQCTGPAGGSEKSVARGGCCGWQSSWAPAEDDDVAAVGPEVASSASDIAAASTAAASASVFCSTGSLPLQPLARPYCRCPATLCMLLTSLAGRGIAQGRSMLTDANPSLIRSRRAMRWAHGSPSSDCSGSAVTSTSTSGVGVWCTGSAATGLAMSGRSAGGYGAGEARNEFGRCGPLGIPPRDGTAAAPAVLGRTPRVVCRLLPQTSSRSWSGVGSAGSTGRWALLDVTG